MSYNSLVSAQFENLRSLAAGSIGASYAPIGTDLDNAKFDKPVRILYVLNNTNESMLFSDDGVDDKFFLPASGFLLLDFTSNRSNISGFYFAQARALYVKHAGVAATTGGVYVTVISGYEQ